MAQTGEPGFRVFSLLQKLGYDRLLFYDAYGRFMCAASLDQVDLLTDLHEYADGKFGKVYYYDIVAFAQSDGDLARRFVESERRHRENITTHS